MSMKTKRTKDLENQRHLVGSLSMDKMMVEKKRKICTIPDTHATVSSPAPIVTPQVSSSAHATSGTGATPMDDNNDLDKVEELSGFIFKCDATTKREFYKYHVFGLPARKKEIVKKIKPGQKLFLFDTDVKYLYGIYEATSAGGLHLERNAFNRELPAQVRFKELQYCLPLPENYFRNLIKDNYLKKGFKFKEELNHPQVDRLLSSFTPLMDPSPEPYCRFPSEMPHMHQTQQALEPRPIPQGIQIPGYDYGEPTVNMGNHHQTTQPRALPVSSGPASWSNIQQLYLSGYAIPPMPEPYKRNRYVQETPNQNIGLLNELHQLPMQMEKQQLPMQSVGQTVQQGENDFHRVLPATDIHVPVQPDSLFEGGAGLSWGNVSTYVENSFPHYQLTCPINEFCQLPEQREMQHALQEDNAFKFYNFNEGHTASYTHVSDRSDASTSGGNGISVGNLPTSVKEIFSHDPHLAFGSELYQLSLQMVNRNVLGMDNAFEYNNDSGVLPSSQTQVPSNLDILTVGNVPKSLQEMERPTVMHGEKFSENYNNGDVLPARHAPVSLKSHASPAGGNEKSSGDVPTFVLEMVPSNQHMPIWNNMSQMVVHTEGLNVQQVDNSFQYNNRNKMLPTPHAPLAAHSYPSSARVTAMPVENVPSTVQEKNPNDPHSDSGDNFYQLVMHMEKPTVLQGEECDEVHPLALTLVPVQSNALSGRTELSGENVPTNLQEVVPHDQDLGIGNKDDATGASHVPPSFLS